MRRVVDEKMVEDRLDAVPCTYLHHPHDTSTDIQALPGQQTQEADCTQKF